MSIRLGDVAPDFEAKSSKGTIKPYLRTTPQPNI